MGLISGMVIGMVAGIALMAGWKQMMRYRGTKRVSKAVDIKLLGSLGRDELNKICGDNFPEWMSFLAFDQVKWLNKQISKMWPLVAEVFDKDVGQDKRLGVAKLPLNELVAEKAVERELRLLPVLDMLKIKDKKDRGTLTIKVFYHQFDKEEQLAAMESEKKMLEERQRLKEAGLMGSTMDALDGAASLVSSGVGFVGTGIAAGAGLVGSGIGAGANLVGSGIEAGAGLVGSGIGAGVGLVGSGTGAVGSGLGKAGKFMTRGVSNHLGGSSMLQQHKGMVQQVSRRVFPYGDISVILYDFLPLPFVMLRDS